MGSAGVSGSLGGVREAPQRRQHGNQGRRARELGGSGGDGPGRAPGAGMCLACVGEAKRGGSAPGHGEHACEEQ